MAAKGTRTTKRERTRSKGRGPKLTRYQRKVLSRLRRHSYGRPYVTRSVTEKMEILELESLGLIECQWSEDWARPVLFAWVVCQECTNGIRFADEEVDGLVPFDRCPDCARYEHDLAAAGVLDSVAPVESLEIEQHETIGFAVQRNRLDAAKHFLTYQLTSSGR